MKQQEGQTDEQQIKTSESKIEEQKLYGCGICKKRYKSYPAFYTHITHAHNITKPPAGSDLPKKESSKKGRPSNTSKTEENKNLAKLISKDFLLKYCDQLQIKAMDYDCVDDILIFLTELNSEYIAKVGEERVEIENVWKEELSEYIQELAPKLFDKDLEFKSIDSVFQDFLSIICLDLKHEIIKELLLFFAVLNNYVQKMGGFNESQLKEFPNIEWKQWKEKNFDLIKNFKVVGTNTYDLCNENIEFLLHFFLKYLQEAGILLSQ